MNFEELVTEVVGWTKRPDMDTRIRSALRRAILASHRREKLWKDLETVTVGALASNTVQTINIAASLPQFRQLSYVKVTGQDIFMDPVDADDLLDNDGYAKTGIVFLAGTVLNIKAKAALTSVDIQYWKDPIVTPTASLNSWIAADYPDLLIAAATKTVLAFDNESEIYKAAQIQEAEEWAELIRNNIEAQGR